MVNIFNGFNPFLVNAAELGQPGRVVVGQQAQQAQQVGQAQQATSVQQAQTAQQAVQSTGPGNRVGLVVVGDSGVARFGGNPLFAAPVSPIGANRAAPPARLAAPPPTAARPARRPAQPARPPAPPPAPAVQVIRPMPPAAPVVTPSRVVPRPARPAAITDVAPAAAPAPEVRAPRVDLPLDLPVPSIEIDGVTQEFDGVAAKTTLDVNEALLDLVELLNEFDPQELAQERLEDKIGDLIPDDVFDDLPAEVLDLIPPELRNDKALAKALARGLAESEALQPLYRAADALRPIFERITTKALLLGAASDAPDRAGPVGSRLPQPGLTIEFDPSIGLRADGVKAKAEFVVKGGRLEFGLRGDIDVGVGSVRDGFTSPEIDVEVEARLTVDRSIDIRAGIDAGFGLGGQDSDVRAFGQVSGGGIVGRVDFNAQTDEIRGTVNIDVIEGLRTLRDLTKGR